MCLFTETARHFCAAQGTIPGGNGLLQTVLPPCLRVQTWNGWRTHVRFIFQYLLYLNPNLKIFFSKANQLLRMWFSSAAEHQVPLTVLVSLKTSFRSQPMDNSSLRRQHTRGYLYAWYQIQGDTESTQTPMKGSEWKDTNSLQSIITETSCWWHRAVTLVFRFTTHALCGFQNRYRP